MRWGKVALTALTIMATTLFTACEGAGTNDSLLRSEEPIIGFWDLDTIYDEAGDYGRADIKSLGIEVKGTAGAMLICRESEFILIIDGQAFSGVWGKSGRDTSDYAYNLYLDSGETFYVDFDMEESFDHIDMTVDNSGKKGISFYRDEL